jgi:signal transduction histidine kinase
LAVVETSAGDLWIAGNRGVWRVPRAVRGLPQHAPSIALVRAQVDADAYRPQAAIELQPDEHRLELEFAALSFRDRSLLRYRSRIGDEGQWSAPSSDSRLQFAALEPGAYRAQMSASLDGEHWSEPPAAVDFRVLPPWYRTVWARILFALAALALLALIYRLRVASLLRVESERTRIAMDLHDEIGAGLGSIGMLAGAAARTRTDAVEQQRIVREIAEVSNLLGSGLRSLVWSLRSSKAGATELGEQIADHARRMFPGEEPRLSMRLPGHDAALPLTPEVRRHVLLFALEALHNISRHAHANQVNLHLDATTDGGLRLSIEDDGRGFDTGNDAPGTGLASMRRRALAIRAAFDISSTPGSGTRVTLTRARDPRHA